LSLEEAVEGADVIVVAVPPLAMPGLFPKLKGIGEDAVVTDVGSVKSFVIEAARQGMGERFPQFVPAHPIAGSEKSGVEASAGDLFQGRRVVITPVEETSREALGRVRNLWEQTGAHVEVMEAGHHDRILAQTSHLPHMMAFALMEMLAERREAVKFSAGGLRDIARIAGSDPALWRDIALTNREALLEALQHFSEAMRGLAQAIEHREGERLLEHLTKGREGWNTLVKSMSKEL
ncbi:MAG: prephenate dehydrogenase/arogenate dehydrogenase family protein, partial [Gammaproteobacteria bacterium]